MSMHFGRCGREGLASLQQLDIVFMTDDHNPNVEYTTINHFETTKKNHGVESNQIEKNPPKNVFATPTTQIVLHPH